LHSRSSRIFVHAAVILLIVSTFIATLGGAAVTVYAFRWRRRERFLLWFGLFSILYGIVLIVRNSVFRLGFGQPQGIELSLERLISLSTIVPGLLLFGEFYGPGWRSSLRWLTGGYCILATVAVIAGRRTSPLELILFPGTALIVILPLVLTVGYFAGYRPRPVPQRRILFAGWLGLFCAFSIDRVLHTELGNWHSGVEPYGFLTLVICLSYVAARRVITDEHQLLSLTDEMRAAATIQEAILPEKLPSLPNVELAVRYAPMTAIAGDFYDFPTVGPNGVSVLVADVLGHGVPAALIASMVKVAVSTQVKRDSEPASVVAGLNSILSAEAHGQYVTAVYLRIDVVNWVGRYTAAGHPPPLLWRRRKRELEVLGETGLLLGVRPNEAYTESEFRFETGDRLLLYTDGLTDPEDATGESFGDAALLAFIREKQDLEGEEFADLLLKAALAWPGNGARSQQKDDITILVIDLHGSANVEP
jgi:sigma-B regulation protein RsbU (phosphoserine phosphatase)